MFYICSDKVGRTTCKQEELLMLKNSVTATTGTGKNSVTRTLTNLPSYLSLGIVPFFFLVNLFYFYLFSAVRFAAVMTAQVTVFRLC